MNTHTAPADRRHTIWTCSARHKSAALRACNTARSQAPYGRLPGRTPPLSLPEGSLLFPTGPCVVLLLAGDDLPQHHAAVAVQEGHAREALAVLEGVADQRLLRLEAALRHLVGLQRVW